MHRFTKVAPSRDALLAEASEEMQALLRFCFSHINCGELIALHAPPGSGEDELGLLDLVERVMSQPEGAVLTDKKVLWKHRIDSAMASFDVPVGRRLDGSVVRETRSASLEPSTNSRVSAASALS